MADKKVHALLQGIFQFREPEYEQWVKILWMEEKVSDFLKHLRTRMLAIHVNSAESFIERYLGEYAEVETNFYPGEATLTFWTPSMTQGIVGQKFVATRDRIEYLRLHRNGENIVAGVQFSLPLRKD